MDEERMTAEELTGVPDQQPPEKSEGEKAVEDHMEQVVVLAREKILPYLKERNKNVEESKRSIEMLSITINQGLFLLMKSTLVSALELKEKVNPNFPDHNAFIQLIELLEGETMENAIEVLQWMNSKIDAVLKTETKERDFASLNIDF